MNSGCSASRGSGGQCGIRGGECLVIEDVAAFGHRAVHAGGADDDDRAQMRQVGHDLVDAGLDRRGAALAAGAVGRDERPRLGDLHPFAHRLRAEAAEDDVVRRADARARQHRDDNLRDHRKVDADDVALADAADLENVRESLDVTQEIGVGDSAGHPLLAVPVEGDPVPATGFDVPIRQL